LKDEGTTCHTGFKKEENPLKLQVTREGNWKLNNACDTWTRGMSNLPIFDIKKERQKGVGGGTSAGKGGRKAKSHFEYRWLRKRQASG